MPVVVTTMYLYYRSQVEGTSIDWVGAVLALLLIVVMHAAGNVISDYYDYTKGVDRQDSLNGVTWIYNGMFRPEEIKRFGFTLLAIACVAGLVILQRVGWSVAWIGVLGLLCAAFYPWLKSHALGDYEILCCFALLPSLGTGYVVCGQYRWDVVLLSLTYGLMTVGVLHSNNTRDIKSDRQAGIRTLAMQIGSRISRRVYAAEMLLPFALLLIYSVTGMMSFVCCILSMLVFVPSYRLAHQMLTTDPEAETEIVGVDQKTAQTQMLFSLLLSLGFVLYTLILL